MLAITPGTNGIDGLEDIALAHSSKLVAGLFAGTVFAASLAAAQTPEAAPATGPLPLDGKTIHVAMRQIPPFVFTKDDKLTGFSLELWDKLAEATGAKTEITVIDTLPNLLDAVKTQKADLAIAAISITAKRELDFDFSQPMFDSGLTIAVRNDPASNASGWSAIQHMFSSGPILNLLGLLALLILIPAHLIWLFDRNHEQTLLGTKKYFPGIFNAIWWATGAAGGQQMENPRSGFGKFIQAVWVFISVIFVAYFTAAVTSAMTVDQLKGDIGGAEDLPGRKVGVVLKSTSSDVVKAIGAKVTEYPQIADAFAAMQKKDIDAVVYDAPILLYYASHDGRGKVQIVGSIFHHENYGILFPPGSTYRKPVNEALLKLKENGIYDALYKRWFSMEGGGG